MTLRTIQLDTAYYSKCLEPSEPPCLQRLWLCIPTSLHTACMGLDLHDLTWLRIREGEVSESQVDTSGPVSHLCRHGRIQPCRPKMDRPANDPRPRLPVASLRPEQSLSDKKRTDGCDVAPSSRQYRESTHCATSLGATKRLAYTEVRAGCDVRDCGKGAFSYKDFSCHRLTRTHVIIALIARSRRVFRRCLGGRDLR